MAKIGKIFKTGIIAAAAAAGTYYLVKNKDELLQRAKDFAEKLSEKAEDPDVEVEIDFDMVCDFDEGEATEAEECTAEDFVREDTAE